jgi:hypothetical protein
MRCGSQCFILLIFSQVILASDHVSGGMKTGVDGSRGLSKRFH